MSTNKYRVHRFDLRMTADQSKLELFLNSLESEIISIIPNTTATPFTRDAALRESDKIISLCP